MKIEHLIGSLDEARRNNFGRETSNAQGQALGKQLATNAPGAQQALAQAKGAQATNQPDPRGDTLGQTTPAQRLAAQKAAAGTTAVPTPTTPATPTTPPTTPADTTAEKPATDTTKPPAGAKKSWWDWANSEKSGDAVSKFGRGMADAGSALGTGVANAARAGANAVQGVGDLAAATAGGIGQTIGAAAGGLGAGYHTARQRKSFGSAGGGFGAGGIGDPNRPDPYYSQGGGGGSIPGHGANYSGGAASGGGNAAGDAEVAKLKSDIAAITGRLNKAGIAEKKR
jgi:hypothetical protein